jgi:hypothetical protein
MAQFSPNEYDTLERAIASGRRLALYRRGTEYVVIPRRLSLVASRETIEVVHPTTGERIEFTLDEIDRFEVVP